MLQAEMNIILWNYQDTLEEIVTMKCPESFVLEEIYFEAIHVFVVCLLS